MGAAWRWAKPGWFRSAIETSISKMGGAAPVRGMSQMAVSQRYTNKHRPRKAPKASKVGFLRRLIGLGGRGKNKGARGNRRIKQSKTSADGGWLLGPKRLGRGLLTLLGTLWRLGLWCVGWLAVGLGALLGGVSVQAIALESPYVQLARIEVLGTARTPDAAIRAQSGLQTGIPLWRLDLDAAARRVMALPWVAKVHAIRRWPSTVEIVVVEHQPAFVVASEGLFLVDRDGHLFKRYSPKIDGVWPVFSAPATLLENRSALAKALQRGRALRLRVRKMGGQLEQLDWDPDLGFRAVILAAGFTLPIALHLGTSPESRIGLAFEALDKLRPFDRIPRELWLDGGHDRNRIHVRFASQDGSRSG